MAELDWEPHYPDWLPALTERREAVATLSGVWPTPILDGRWSPHYPTVLWPTPGRSSSLSPVSGALYVPVHDLRWIPLEPALVGGRPRQPWLIPMPPSALDSQGAWATGSWAPSLTTWLPARPWVWTMGPLAAEALIVIGQQFPWPARGVPPVEYYHRHWRPFPVPFPDALVQGPWPCVHLAIQGQAATALGSPAQTATGLTALTQTGTALTQVEVC